MSLIDSVDIAPPPQAFTVLIPRTLQPTVNGLPTDARQTLLAELFRLAAHASQERKAVSDASSYTLQLEVAGCTATMEMDTSRARLLLTRLTRPRVRS